MKYITKSLLLLLAVALVCALVSCKKDCERGHKDTNGDEKCDRCGTAVTSPDECTEHTDDDNNARCDRCGQSLVNPDDDTPEEEVSLVEDGKILF